jgi:plasmid stabilization system protein ParE
MAYQLIWSPAARDDLHNIIVFIACDNPERAMSFGYELISDTDRLQQFPELGRIVPEGTLVDIFIVQSRNHGWKSTYRNIGLAL